MITFDKRRVFPFCPIDAMIAGRTIGTGSRYAISTGDKGKLSDWYNLVKVWRVTITVNLRYDHAPGEFETYIGTGFFDIPSVALTENDTNCLAGLNTIVGGATATTIAYHSEDGVNPPVDLMFSATLLMGLFLDGTGGTSFPEQVVTDSGLYYPQFALHGDINSILIQETDSSAGPVTGSELMFDGVSFPGLLYGDLTIAGDSPSPSQYDLDVTTHEFFPYDPGDGLGAIINTTTGAMLRQLP